MNTHFPNHGPTYARVCLGAIAHKGLGHKISLGGAFGLLYYLDYRPTNDVDAWWVESATTDDQRFVIQEIENALEQFGQVQIRKWGDVFSIELLQDDEKVFSFQIARRSVQLQPSITAPGIDILLDSFPDLISSKMVALVERGAPRDFRDIYTVCEAGLTTPEQCWKWWRERQRLAKENDDPQRARLAIQTHLARIVQHRPLSDIRDDEQRESAERVRNWFGEDFLNELMD
jgi:hypothetical protein